VDRGPGPGPAGVAPPAPLRASRTVTLVRDTTTPTVAIAAPTASVLAGSTLSLSGTTSDPGAGATGVTRVEVRCNGSGRTRRATLSANGTWTHAVRVRGGTLAVEVAAIDGAWNRSTPARRTVTVDPTAPTATIRTPATGTVTRAARLDVTGGAADTISGRARVEVRLNGGAWTAATGADRWRRGVVLRLGTHTIEARAVDQAGNASAVVRRTLRRTR